MVSGLLTCARGRGSSAPPIATQDDAIERLTQIYAEKKKTAPSVAEAAANSVSRRSRNTRSSGALASAG